MCKIDRGDVLSSTLFEIVFIDIAFYIEYMLGRTHLRNGDIAKVVRKQSVRGQLMMHFGVQRYE